tara:strand:+ start:1324 stop:1773 length:450 start_codon:yes stop_codon:yes gene_type:complete
MKFGRTRTLRGQITVVGGVARENLIVSDGLVNMGFLVERFVTWDSKLPNGTGNRFHTGILSLDTMIPGTDMNAGDNRQIAWSMSSVNGVDGGIIQPMSIIDPDHIVNRDLFLIFTDSTDAVYNYLIEGRVVSLTDDEAIITIIKETSQA